MKSASMGRQRRQFTGAFKAKIALEAIKGQRTVLELATAYRVHSNQITNSEKQLIAAAADAFIRSTRAAGLADESEKDELYRQIGKLQVELDWLQKPKTRPTVDEADEVGSNLPKPKLSKPAPGHRFYPYLLRNVKIERPNQVWSTDVRLPEGFVYLVAVLDWPRTACPPSTVCGP